MFHRQSTHTLTLVVYKLISKGSAGILAIPQHKSFDYTVLLTSSSLTPGAWNELTPTSPWVGLTSSYNRTGIWYRANINNIDVTFSINRTLAFSGLLGTLPVGYRPAYNHSFRLITPYPYTNDAGGGVIVYTNGRIEYNAGTAEPNALTGTISIPLT